MGNYWFKIPGPSGWVIDGYHVPFDDSCFDGKEWLTDKICTHSFLHLGFAISDGTW
jgi:hypothetical protein